MSSDNQSSRRLAAILFADIQGYTALMQKDEKAASTLLKRFQSELEIRVPEFNGEIVNFYGDGAFCTFQNPLEAIKCAIQLQSNFRKDPIVPLRIGIHSGTVVIENGKAYGDSVNVASRIESMGIPGSILVSKKVRDELKNQPDLLLPSLGKFEFKNVEEPMEVFALANEGFVVPKPDQVQGKFKKPEKTKKNKWLVPAVIGVLLVLVVGFWQFQPMMAGFDSPLSEDIRNKRIAVMVFENQTMDSDMEAFGTMISDWITRGLMETNEANVISGANIQNQIQLAGVGQTAMKQIAQTTGVGVFLQGRYYLQEDQLIIHANVVDANSGEVIHALDPIQGPKDKMLSLLEQLTEKILGYWAVEKQTRFLQNPPKYEAYLKWLKAEEVFYVDREQCEIHLKEALEIDSTFYMALLKLVPLYGNMREWDLRQEVLDYLKTKESNFTRWEQLRYNAFVADQNCDFLESAKNSEERFKMDESDITGNNNAAQSYIRANYPKRALDVMNQYDLRLRDMNALASQRELWMSIAHFMLGEYEEAIITIEQYPFKSKSDFMASIHLSSLIHLNDFEGLETTYSNYVNDELYGLGTNTTPYLLYSICNYLLITDQVELCKTYADKMMAWNENHLDDPDYIRRLGFIFHFKGEYENAINTWKSDTANLDNASIQASIGICYAKLNNPELATKQIELISALEVNETNKRQQSNRLYEIAKVYAALGHQDKAIDLLENAWNNCLPAGGLRYQYDHTLMPLFENPRFQELVKPKG